MLHLTKMLTGVCFQLCGNILGRTTYGCDVRVSTNVRPYSDLTLVAAVRPMDHKNIIMRRKSNGISSTVRDTCSLPSEGILF